MPAKRNQQMISRGWLRMRTGKYGYDCFVDGLDPFLL